MKRVGLIAFAAVLALSFAAGAQGAGAVNTKVDLAFLLPTDDGDLVAIGTLSAGDDRCVPDRLVKISLIANGGKPVPIDTARTANRGGWMGIRKVSSIPDRRYDEARVFVPESTVRLSKNKQITCGAKTKSFPLAG